MQAKGIDADATKARVAALTDEEVHKIAGNMDKLPAGGDLLGILFTILLFCW